MERGGGGHNLDDTSLCRDWMVKLILVPCTVLGAILSCKFLFSGR